MIISIPDYSGGQLDNPALRPGLSGKDSVAVRAFSILDRRRKEQVVAKYLGHFPPDISIVRALAPMTIDLLKADQIKVE